MKRAFYVGNFAKPQNSAAGKRVYNNALLLVSCGFDVLMVGTDSSNKGNIEPITEHISYVSFPNYGKVTGWKYFNWLKKHITASSTKPSLLFRYGSPGLATFDYYVYRYARKNKLPLIVDVVDWLQIDSNRLLFKLAKSLDTWLEKTKFNKQGDGLIAISSYLYNYYSACYRDKIILPPLVENYTANTAVNETPQIIYAGNPFRKGQEIKDVHAIKDRLDLVILAFYELAKKGKVFDLHIVGLTKEDYLTAFPQHQKQVDSTSRIHFYGYQTMEQVHTLMKQMDFSILLRENNRATCAGFPTKAVESMSLGVPVITTDTSDLSGYIDSGKNGFFVTIQDFNQLQQQLNQILEIPNQIIKALKQHNYEQQAFHYRNYIERFRRFIDSILADTNSGEK